MDLTSARQRARFRNLESEFGRDVVSRLVCPACGTGFRHHGDRLVCDHHHEVEVVNGCPDFVVFSERSIDEKMEQAAFHDDEQRNETFEEIVLRPFNLGSEVHVESQLHHLRRFERLLPDKLGMDLDGALVLNCGCGGGFEAQFLAERGARVVGFDISQLRTQAATTRFALHELTGTFYRGDAAVLPFADDSFDLAVYHDSLHHVPIHEIFPALREAVRVSRRGVALLEAQDTPLQWLLESLGRSRSIEDAGNYTFRFRRSLMRFWAHRTGTRLVAFSPTFNKKYHRGGPYLVPVLGRLWYGFLRTVGLLLRPLGNEVCILLAKPGGDDDGAARSMGGGFG